MGEPDGLWQVGAVPEAVLGAGGVGADGWWPGKSAGSDLAGHNGLTGAEVKDPEPSVRDWACYGLSNIGPDAKDAVPALEDLLLHDKTMKVRRIAANALGSIGPDAREAVPALQGAARDPDAAVRSYAAKALERVQGGP